jgi:hypothetical protein
MLAELPNLQALHIWFDSRDLRPWYVPVSSHIYLFNIARPVPLLSYTDKKIKIGSNMTDNITVCRHKRVSETRFFKRLFDVRVLDRTRFVLALPELPEKRGTSDIQVLESHYLEGDRIEHAPFTIVREPRPNNWQVLLQSHPGNSVSL